MYKIETLPVGLLNLFRERMLSKLSVVEVALRTQENELRGLLRMKSTLGDGDFGFCD